MKSLVLALLAALTFIGGTNTIYADEKVTEDVELSEFDEFEEFDEDVVETYDPLEGFNRAMFSFNEGMLKYVLSPIGKGYSAIMPESGRQGVDRMFKNVRYPIRLVNNVLQLKFQGAADETGRFVVNTTGGLLGFYDNADKWFELKPHKTDFGKTLGYWGVGSGVPLTLPVFRESNVRDALGKIPDHFLNPVSWIDPQLASLGVSSVDAINTTSLHEEKYWNLREDAIDPYTFFRDTYKQSREASIETSRKE